MAKGICFRCTEIFDMSDLTPLDDVFLCSKCIAFYRREHGKKKSFIG